MNEKYNPKDVIVAYNLVESLKKYEKYLNEDKVYVSFFNASVNSIAQEYCHSYWKNYIPAEGKDELNEYELYLFRRHPAFIEEIMTYAGHKLIKELNK